MPVNSLPYQNVRNKPPFPRDVNPRLYDQWELDRQARQDIIDARNNYDNSIKQYPITARDKTLSIIRNYQDALTKGLDTAIFVVQLLDLGLTVAALARMGIRIAPNVWQNLNRNRTINNPNPDSSAITLDNPLSGRDRSSDTTFRPRNVTNTSLPVSGGRTSGNKAPNYQTYDIESYRNALKPPINRPFGC